AEKIRLHNGVAVDPSASPIELLVTPGATGALVSAAHAFLENASALVFEPYYPYHVRILETAGARAEVFPLRGERLELDPDAFRAHCRSAARRESAPLRAIIACSPANPTGKAFTRDELETIAGVCRDLD